MKTKQVYYQDQYKKELDCKIISLEEKGSLVNIVLDQTIFFPEGGGQPSDRGRLEGENGEAKVEYVRLMDGEIVHQSKAEIALYSSSLSSVWLSAKARVKAILDWGWRYKYMRIHTAGHLLHDVLTTISDDLFPLRAGHGKKPFLEYQGELNVAIKDKLETEVNKVLLRDLPVITRQATYKELEKECRFLPPGLPRSKSLRMIKIGNYLSMPDGGVHVKSTKEIGKIWIANIIVKDGKTVIRYGVVL